MPGNEKGKEVVGECWDDDIKRYMVIFLDTFTAMPSELVSIFLVLHVTHSITEVILHI